MVLTGSTTDGVNIVLSGLALGPGDEVLTSHEEHPGLLVPLAVGARRRGYTVRQAPFAEIAQEAGSAKLVACSHVSWITGEMVDAEALASTDALVLLDGAQGLGAVPVDVRRLGCDFYAASGQKWMCGPVGSGYLYVREGRLDVAHPGVAELRHRRRPRTPARGRACGRAPSASSWACRPPEHTAWSAAALDVLEAAGFDDVLAAAADGAERLADRLRESGRTVAPRGPHHAGLVGGARPGGGGRAPAGLRRRGPPPAGPPLRPGLRGRLDERGRHRSPARRARLAYFEVITTKPSTTAAGQQQRAEHAHEREQAGGHDVPCSAGVDGAGGAQDGQRGGDRDRQAGGERGPQHLQQARSSPPPRRAGSSALRRRGDGRATLDAAGEQQGGADQDQRRDHDRRPPRRCRTAA